MNLVDSIVDFAKLLKEENYTILDLPEELYDLSTSRTRWELSINLSQNKIHPSKDFSAVETTSQCVERLKETNDLGDTVYYTLNFIALHESFMKRDLMKFITEGVNSYHGYRRTKVFPSY